MWSKKVDKSFFFKEVLILLATKICYESMAVICTGIFFYILDSIKTLRIILNYIQAKFY